MITKRLIAILLCVFAFFGTMCLVFNLNHRLPYVECNDGFEYVDTVFEPITMTKEEAKRAVEKLFGNPKYIYKEQGGRSHSVAFFRYVVIEEDCPIDWYIMALTHELVHITEFVGCERYAEYRTFVKLYKSDNEQLRQVAGEVGNFAYFKNFPQEYQCWYYIYNYLKGEQQ